MNFSEKKKNNEWEHSNPSLQEVVDFVKEATKNGALGLPPKGGWTWIKNSDCKYIQLRIDMRDGGFVICDGEGRRISFDALKYQYSKETPERPK